MKKSTPIIAISSILSILTPVTSLSTPMADPSAARSTNRQFDFKGGAGVGRLVLSDDIPLDKWDCKYDMVLVERIQGRPKTESGLFVPRENLPKLHLCRGEFVVFNLRCQNIVMSYNSVSILMDSSILSISVIAMGPGREEENGLIAPMPKIKPGDVVIAKNPWGIGPKDEETADGKKLSFMRGGDIAAVLEGKLLEEV
jgi:co-chaperonin GroES (HSP10)